MVETNHKTQSFDGVLLTLDDERDIVDILVECASRAGVRACGAVTPAEAEHILETENVFLLLVDLRMPEEDGLSFFSRMHQKYPRLPAVLVTANVEPTSLLQANRLGMLKVIEKPFRIADIVSVIREQKNQILHEQELQLKAS